MSVDVVREEEGIEHVVWNIDWRTMKVNKHGHQSHMQINAEKKNSQYKGSEEEEEKQKKQGKKPTSIINEV